MHNNFTIDRNRTPKKSSYTVVEAAVLLARSAGAKSAGDPSINRYTQMLLASLEKGELKAEDAGQDSSLSPVLSAGNLRAWAEEQLPTLRPAFLFD